MLFFNDKEIKTDSQGYLINSHQWHEDLVPLLAKEENIILTNEHLEIIYFVRSFYQTFNTSPTIRMLVKGVLDQFGDNKGNSRYLYRLFPTGPAKQAAKLAGLPKPVKCI
ncbi:Sulfurtransferase TusE [Candidatus Hartigia pinicola]|nr:Sulfurtransferase TusE [Candidatus Hartigia pinicola]